MRLLKRADFKEGFSGVVLVRDDWQIIFERPFGYRNF